MFHPYLSSPETYYCMRIIIYHTLKNYNYDSQALRNKIQMIFVSFDYLLFVPTVYISISHFSYLNMKQT